MKTKRNINQNSPFFFTVHKGEIPSPLSGDLLHQGLKVIRNKLNPTTLWQETFGETAPTQKSALYSTFQNNHKGCKEIYIGRKKKDQWGSNPLYNTLVPLVGDTSQVLRKRKSNTDPYSTQYLYICSHHLRKFHSSNYTFSTNVIYFFDALDVISSVFSNPFFPFD